MNSRKIPSGAIMIPLPLVRQPDNYSCGAGALMSIASYFGVGPAKIDEFKEALCTSSIYGTYHRDIARYANEIGLNAEVRINMTRSQLKSLLKSKTPVILSLQAWAADTSVYEDPDHNKDGHYIVAIGYDDNNYFYFMDPSITGKLGYLSWEELKKRWHEDEGFEKEEVHKSLGIIIRPGNAKADPIAFRID